MKKTKKLLALMMVLATLLSVLVIPAAAAAGSTNEPIEPRYAVGLCPKCGNENAKVVNPFAIEKLLTYSVTTCDFKTNETHDHQVQRTYVLIDCPHCSRVEDNVQYRVMCLPTNNPIS